MTNIIKAETVWAEIRKQLFAVIAMVTAGGEARSSGIVFIEHDRLLFISASRTSWKAKHILNNPSVSLTIPIHKSVPMMPWIKIPAATITFCGQADVMSPEEVDADLLHRLYQGQEKDPKALAETVVIRVRPEGDFVTYGVGIPLLDMRFPEKARGRAPINP